CARARSPEKHKSSNRKTLARWSPGFALTSSPAADTASVSRPALKNSFAVMANLKCEPVRAIDQILELWNSRIWSTALKQLHLLVGSEAPPSTHVSAAGAICTLLLRVSPLDSAVIEADRLRREVIISFAVAARSYVRDDGFFHLDLHVLQLVTAGPAQFDC